MTTPCKNVLNKFHKLHARTQELLVLLILSIVPILIITALIYGIFYKRMQNQIRRDTSNIINQISYATDIITNQLEAISTTLIYTERIQNYLHNIYMEQKISRADIFTVEQGIAIFYDNTYMRNITVYDINYNSVQFPIEVSNNSKKLIQDHTYDTFSHRPIWTLDGKNRLIHLIRPIESSRNFTLLGFLDIVLYPEALKKQFTQIDFDQKGKLILLDEHMIPITGTLEQLPENITANITANSGSFITRISKKESYFVFYQKSSITHWTTVGLIARQTFYSDIKQIMLIVFIFILSIISTAIYFSFMFSHYSVERVNRLTTAMEHFSKGHLTTYLEPDDNPEFGEVCNHFNNMVKQINDLINSKYRSELLKQKAELKMLQAQINPHFLYNTLNVMYWKAEISSQKDIAQMILSLANLLRTSMNRNIDFVTLKEEIANINDYLYIQRIRFQEKVTVKICIPKSIEMYMLPKLILQPVIENAFVHGMEPKAGNGTITISAEEIKDDLLLIITDDGVGIDKAILKTLLTKHPEKGCQGLYNVHKRIQLYYGMKYGVSIKSSSTEGTSVMIKLSKRRKKYVPRSSGR
ncbi:sensor histidine kinase [Treponema sp. HNW]|uniref:cache domain-containing sensor histidine kinase n=1 Tax=Treponema sp. HNW TaxID=3116654 RepID=UPI003D11E25F